MLLSKTIPDVKNRKHHALKPKPLKTRVVAAPPRKKARIASGTDVEVIEGDGHGTISPASSFQASYPVPAKVCNIS